MAKEELFKGLTKEQIAKLKACKTTEEALKVAKEEGLELDIDELTSIAGGSAENINEKPEEKDREKNPMINPF